MDGLGGKGMQGWSWGNGHEGPNAGRSGTGGQGKGGKPAGKNLSKRRADKNKLQHAVRMVAKCLDNDNRFLGDKITPTRASKKACNARAGQIGWRVEWELAEAMTEGGVRKEEWRRWRSCVRNVQGGATLDTVEQDTAVGWDMSTIGQGFMGGEGVLGVVAGSEDPSAAEEQWEEWIAGLTEGWEWSGGF